ncbi:MAG: acyltransferase [Chitinophagaceae bacterium]
MRIYKKIFERVYRAAFGNIKYARLKGAKIGKGCRMFTTFIGSEPFLITIGDNVHIGPGVKLITHDGSTTLMTDGKGRRYSYQPIEIGNNVFIGVNCVIMPGVKIEDNVIVGAGSVVTKSLKARSVVAGVPARIIANYDELEKRMLDNLVGQQELDFNLPYKERVLKVTQFNFKPTL